MNYAALAADACPAQIAFTGTTLVGAYCTGTDATATQPKLVTVAAGGAPVVRIDNALPADAFQPTWFADNSGTKLFVLGPKPGNEGRVVVATGATTTVAVVDQAIDAISVAKDGSYALYTTAGALKKATFAAAPVVTPIVPTGVLGLLSISTDSKRVVYYTQEDTQEGLTNASAVDVTAAVPAPVALVTTPTASVVGFTGTGTHVLYMDGFAAGVQTGKLKAKPVGGGAEKILDGASYLAYAAPEGNGVLSVTAAAAAGQNYSLTLKYVDGVVGGALQNGATDVLYTQQGVVSGWSGKTYVHTNIGMAAPGLYALKLP